MLKHVDSDMKLHDVQNVISHDISYKWKTT